MAIALCLCYCFVASLLASPKVIVYVPGFLTTKLHATLSANTVIATLVQLSVRVTTLNIS